MPNATIVGAFYDLQSAEKAFNEIKSIAEKALKSSITVEKHILVEYSEPRFNSDVYRREK
ncbi:hypothetical protein PZ895_07975 [Mesorhizobium sp. YIM 152430]|uniref:hypothetical protein n=1 Tax=Mesorhizobium sp. YIM 152430 TaxID=3031761 RepID=UPI0023DA0E42|nr:hypothetical protein [Mesorhizobium sp. YIM 152430]MDF1599713.1 hypothetical protein [Mesorhizobium sp. YIM 152430]